MLCRRLSILPNNFQLVNYDVNNSAYILASVKLQDHSSLQNRTSNIFEQAENLELDFLDKGKYNNYEDCMLIVTKLSRRTTDNHVHI